MAEAMLRGRLEQRDIDASVSSAGVVADGGGPSETAVQVMAELGSPIAAHRSRLLSAELVASSDLVIGLAREHVREAALLVPEAYPRTFTLKELVRRGAEVGARGDDEPFEMWLARLHTGRNTLMHLGTSPDDDVDDPIGRRPAVYERVADELARLVDQFVDLAWGTEEESVEDPSELAAT
jgi:protein-tyrosine phosphatase